MKSYKPSRATVKSLSGATTLPARFFRHSNTSMVFDAANSPPSRSHFQTSVNLQDWWLTKPQPEDDRNKIGVSGLTSTSQRSRAERCFTSAPILKAYNIFELETVDGISINLQGYINKEKTLESGFSPEVFDHFIIGYPSYWEEFSTSCPKGGSADECVSRENEEGENSMGNLDGEFLHHDSHTKDSGAEDSEDTFFIKKASPVCDASSSLDTPHEHTMKGGHEFVCDTNVVGNYLLLKNLKKDGSKVYVKVCSRRTTRSMTKTGSSKNDLAHGSGIISDMEKVTFVDPNNLDIARKDKDDAEQNGHHVVEDHAIIESQLDSMRSDVQAKRLKARKSGPLDSLRTTRSMGLSQNKKRDTSGGVDAPAPHKETVAAMRGIASITQSKSKRKLTFESEMAERQQHITTPKSTSNQTPKKGSMGRCVSAATVLSPESVSGGKRSRSGRVLLPSLEFWRNQIVVYDGGLDRHVTGILDTPQSSKDTFHNGKFSKKKDKKACRQ